MKVGMVCPYALDVPGGVQAHVLEIAEELIKLGNDVNVIAPAGEDVSLPSYVTSAGRAVAIPYNGSVARLAFGPRANFRLKHWIKNGAFDVLHIHEPNAPSISMLALRLARGPIVTTFHTSTTRSLVLSVFQGVLKPFHERIRGKIAVSELARRWQMESLGSDAVEIPNGIRISRFAEAAPFDGYPRDGKTIVFLGRFDEPRKGMQVLARALPKIVGAYPDVEILVIGRGDESALRAEVGALAEHLTFLGQVDDGVKASALASADIYCAPNTGGESFGIVLVEAMASGAAVVASDLDAFRRVLDDGAAGQLFAAGSSEGLAHAIVSVLDDEELRTRLINRANEVVTQYDWSVVSKQILRVYETVIVGDGPVTLACD